MVKRSYNLPESEPESKSFPKPSEREHLFCVSNIFTSDDNPFKNGLPEDVVAVQLEVVSGEEAGRTMLQRLTLDDTARGFFATRLFLKAVGLPHKGTIEIDTDDFQARQFYATVVHNGDFANIDTYNFDKKIEQQYQKPLEATPKIEEVEWDS